MVSNILHRISKKGKTSSLPRQFFSRPAGMMGAMKIVIRDSSWWFVFFQKMDNS
jgi:hypothetical protein